MATISRPEPEIIAELRASPTVPVWPTAGKALGVGRHAAYAACRGGQVEMIQIGRKWRVLSKPLLHMLGED